VSAAVDPVLVSRAAAGDGEALEAVLSAIKDDVYRLSVRTLWHPADAEDATQEILAASAVRPPSRHGCTAWPSTTC
jgi:DNA-directed RNA polymerase specialized sigma24 family protein